MVAKLIGWSWIFQARVLKPECWFCAKLGDILLYLNWKPGVKKIAVESHVHVAFKLYSLFQSSDLLYPCCWFLMLFGSAGDASSTVSHLPWPSACTHPAPSLSALVGALPGLEFLTGGWDQTAPQHRVGCQNLLRRPRCCRLRHHLHVCSQTR